MVQGLLVRALVAWLWEHPYRKPLIRWATDLHDRLGTSTKPLNTMNTAALTPGSAALEKINAALR